MTPTQKIQAQILLDFKQFDKTLELPELTAENIDRVYDDVLDKNDQLSDFKREFASSGEESNIPAQPSRNYETKSMALKMFDGSWVGWTYWYGGGKHGNPESIDWISDAYDLDVVEEKQRVVIDRTFAIKP